MSNDTPRAPRPLLTRGPGARAPRVPVPLDVDTTGETFEPLFAVLEFVLRWGAIVAIPLLAGYCLGGGR